MAFVGFAVPPQTSLILSEVDFGDFGEREPPGKYHVTVLYLGDAIPIQQIARLIPVLLNVVSRTNPFSLSVNRVTTFPPGDDGVPIICPVVSNDLHTFRASLVKAVEEAGIPFPNTYPTFRPHVTIGYGSDPLVYSDNAVDVQFPEVEWGAHELILWGGDSGNDRVVVTFPLSLKTDHATTHRAFVQLAKNWKFLGKPIENS